MKKAVSVVRKGRHWFLALSGREKWIVGGAVATCLAFLLSTVFTELESAFASQDSVVRKRTSELREAAILSTRAKELETRVKRAQATFEQAQMTFEQVYRELDQIVKASLGGTGYDVAKVGGPTDVGLEYQRQTFKLTINAITLPQLVDLLHKIEHGERPMMLGKVDINKASTPGNLMVNFEVASLRKKAAAGA